MSQAFQKDGKAFVKNASGRITDIPASQLDIYVAQGYLPATEDEVKQVPTFQHVFDGNYGQKSVVDPQTLEAMNKLQSGNVAAIADRLANNSGIVHGETLMGAEPLPPMTSRTKDGFPRAQEAGTPHVDIRPASMPAAPTLQRGQIPDNLRETIGRVQVGDTMKEPEQAIKDGDILVTVASAPQTVSVGSRPVVGSAAANVAAARAQVQPVARAASVETISTTDGGTMTVVRPTQTAVDNSATLQAVAEASKVAEAKAAELAQGGQQTASDGTGAATDGGNAPTPAEAAAQPAEHTVNYAADSALPEHTPRYKELVADGRIKTVADLKEWDFAKEKIAGIAAAGVTEIETFRNGLTVE